MDEPSGEKLISKVKKLEERVKGLEERLSEEAWKMYVVKKASEYWSGSGQILEFRAS